MTDQQPPKAARQPAPNLLVDLGPLGIFLLTYWLAGVWVATCAFMVATLAALIWSRLKHGKVSILLMFSGVMVLFFGGLTILLHDETFIKMKPTLYYVMVAGILFFGTLTKKPTLELVMSHAYPELSQRGWHLLTRNFGWFFLGMAVLNEIVWRHSSTGFWLGYKLWGALPLTLLFGALNVPMILRHSPQAEGDTKSSS
ncbi:septation protein IspZ [Chakrabartia godavariana]|nr:septation protein IspZ [Chakrabartia godavariana]